MKITSPSGPAIRFEWPPQRGSKPHAERISRVDLQHAPGRLGDAIRSHTGESLGAMPVAGDLMTSEPTASSPTCTGRDAVDPTGRRCASTGVSARARLPGAIQARLGGDLSETLGGDVAESRVVDADKALRCCSRPLRSNCRLNEEQRATRGPATSLPSSSTAGRDSQRRTHRTMLERLTARRAAHRPDYFLRIQLTLAHERARAIARHSRPH